MNDINQRVCPVEHAGVLDSRIRKLFQNPKKILRPYLKKGMTVLEVGCGPGFFSLDMAEMVGESGKVIAVDLQEGMLQKIKLKIEGTLLENVIKLKKCDINSIGVSEHVDFVLLFYMVHEVANKLNLFKELFLILKPQKIALIVEPPFHVSKADFQKTLELANMAGFITSKGPKMLLHKTAILKKS